MATSFRTVSACNNPVFSGRKCQYFMKCMHYFLHAIALAAIAVLTRRRWLVWGGARFSGGRDRHGYGCIRLIGYCWSTSRRCQSPDSTRPRFPALWCHVDYRSMGSPPRRTRPIGNCPAGCPQFSLPVARRWRRRCRPDTAVKKRPAEVRRTAARKFSSLANLAGQTALEASCS